MKEQANMLFVGQTVKIKLTIHNEDGIPMDLSTASSMALILKKPGGSKITKVPVYETDGTDGRLYYVTSAADLDIPGGWKAQAVVVIGGAEYPSMVSTFTISPRI